MPLVVVFALIGVLLLRHTGPVKTIKNPSFSGHTMGTSYSISIANVSVREHEVEKLHDDVEHVLHEVNRQMSTYIPTSEISQFNRNAAGTPLLISRGFGHVAQFAATLAEQTGGAFDPTVGRLVNLWGFGADGRRKEPPSPEQIAEARASVGYARFKVDPRGTVIKEIDELELDLGAVAKGFGVDRVCEMLQGSGFSDFLVEIGGETRAQGQNAQGGKWRIGVQKPNFGAMHGQSILGVIELSDGAVATSGDYQNFFEDEDGQLYSHIIDPRTAAPAGHTIASVSVFAEDCMTADGLATALYVLGPEEGLAFIETYEGAETLIIVRGAGNTYRDIRSSGFDAATGYQPSE